MNLSQYSDEDLLKIAGMQPDLSGVSDEELYRIAGIPVIKNAPEPTFWEKAAAGVKDLFGYREGEGMRPSEIADAQIRLEARNKGVSKEEHIRQVHPEGEALRRARQYGKDAASGAVGTVEGMAGSLEWLTNGAVGRDLANQARLWQRELSPEEGGFGHALASGAGSMTTFFVPGMGIAKGASVVARVGPRLAAWLGSSTATAMEAMTEAGQVYRNVLSDTKDVGKAEKAATETFWWNLPLLAITNKLGVFGETGGPLKRAIVSSQMEGAQEAGQEYISGKAEGRDVTLGEYLTSYGVGAVTGGGFGALSARMGPKGVVSPQEPVDIKDVPTKELARIAGVEEILAEGEVNAKEYIERVKGERAQESNAPQPPLDARGGEKTEHLGEVVGYNARDGKPIIDMEAKEAPTPHPDPLPVRGEGSIREEEKARRSWLEQAALDSPTMDDFIETLTRRGEYPMAIKAAGNIHRLREMYEGIKKGTVPSPPAPLPMGEGGQRPGEGVVESGLSPEKSNPPQSPLNPRWEEKAEAPAIPFKDEIKSRFPDLTDEDISFIAKETAAKFDSIANAVKDPVRRGGAASTRDAFLKVAESGEVPLARKGKNQGKPLRAFEVGREEFEHQLRAFKEQRDSHRPAGEIRKFGDLDIKPGDRVITPNDTYTLQPDGETLQDHEPMKLDPWDDIEVVDVRKAQNPPASLPPLTKGDRDQEMFANVNRIPPTGLKTDRPQAEDLLEGFRRPEEDRQEGMFGDVSLSVDRAGKRLPKESEGSAGDHPSHKAKGQSLRPASDSNLSIGEIERDVKRVANLASIIKEIERIAAPGTRVEAKHRITIPPDQLRIALEKWGEGADADIKVRGAHRVVRLDQGQFSSLIELSLENMDPNTTPYHEAFHSVQEILLNDEEMRRLAERFPARDGVSSHERQAQAFAQYAAGRQARYPVWVRGIFARIKRFLDSVRSYLRGQGFRSVNDIFERAYKGELRERAVGISEMGDVSLDVDQRSFARQIEGFLKGRLPKDALIAVGKTPIVLQKLGARPLPVVMTQRTAAKVLHVKHGIPADLLKGLPAALSDPIMVFDSATQKDSFVVMTELVYEGKTVIAAVHLNKEINRVEVNDIASVYGKDRNEWFTEQMEKGRLRYMNKEKSHSWSVTVGLQLPKMRGTTNGSTYIILTEADIVKNDMSLDIEQRTVKSTDNLLQKINPRAAENVKVQGRKKDLGFVKGLIGSPGTIEGKARYYVVHAKNVVHKQDRLRGMIDERMGEIFRPLKTKELRQEFEALSWMGDAEGKNYTAEELSEMGVSPTVQTAYLKHRRFHDQVWRLLASHRKAYGGETGHREGHIPHLFENWNVYEGTVSSLPAPLPMGEGGRRPGEGAVESGLSPEKKIVGTFRSLKEATAFANGLSREKNYVIRPKTFHMPDALIAKTVLKDASFFRLVEKLEEGFEITREEAFEMTNEVARRKNRRRFFGHAMQRTGQTGFRKDDLHQILKEYYNSTARYVALDYFKARVVPKFEKDFGVELGRASNALRDKNTARYVEEYINDVNGAPGMIEELLDSSIKNAFGKHIRSERPTIWAVNKALHATAVLKLGLFNLAAGVVNLSQLTNTFSKVPAKHFASAFESSFHPSESERAILRRIGVAFDLGLSDTGGYSMTLKGGKAVRASMFFFRWAERKNRVITALAAYRQARKDLGMGEREARHYAREIVDKTQFDYSVADTARIFRNPAGRLLGQFKPYAVKEIEFIMGLKGAENIKFWIPILLMAGTAGVPLIEGLFDMIEWLTGKDPLTETKKFLMEWAGEDEDKKRVAEIAMYGVASQIGVDMSRRVGTGDVLPKRASDLLGPTINTLMNAKELLSGDKTELVRSLAPSVGNLVTAIETAMNDMEVADPYRRERLKYTATPSEAAIKGLGFRPIKEAKLSDLEEVRQYETGHYTEAQQEYVDRAIEALNDGDAEGFAEAIKKAAEEGVIVYGKAIKNEFLQKLLPQEMRTLLKTRNMLKGGQLERMEFLD
jgi:hypothetical protein